MEETLVDWEVFIERLRSAAEGTTIPFRFDNQLFCCWIQYDASTQEYRCYQSGESFHCETKYVASLKNAIRQLEKWKEAHVQKLRPVIMQSLNFYGVTINKHEDENARSGELTQQLGLW